MKTFQELLNEKIAAEAKDLAAKQRTNADPDRAVTAAAQKVLPPITQPSASSGYAPAAYGDDNVTVRIELRGSNIELFFSECPHESIRVSMKSGGKFRGEKRGNDWIWIGRDTQENREFCERMFNADFGDHEIVEAPDGSSDISRAPKILPVEAVTAVCDLAIDPASAYATYKRQCAQLCAELKCEAADLALIAINVLHKQTFGPTN